MLLEAVERSALLSTADSPFALHTSDYLRNILPVVQHMPVDWSGVEGFIRAAHPHEEPRIPFFELVGTAFQGHVLNCFGKLGYLQQDLGLIHNENYQLYHSPVSTLIRAKQQDGYFTDVTDYDGILKIDDLLTVVEAKSSKLGLHWLYYTRGNIVERLQPLHELFPATPLAYVLVLLHGEPRRIRMENGVHIVRLPLSRAEFHAGLMLHCGEMIEKNDSIQTLQAKDVQREG